MGARKENMKPDPVRSSHLSPADWSPAFVGLAADACPLRLSPLSPPQPPGTFEGWRPSLAPPSWSASASFPASGVPALPRTTCTLSPRCATAPRPLLSAPFSLATAAPAGDGGGAWQAGTGWHGPLYTSVHGHPPMLTHFSLAPTVSPPAPDLEAVDVLHALAHSQISHRQDVRVPEVEHGWQRRSGADLVLSARAGNRRCSLFVQSPDR